MGEDNFDIKIIGIDLANGDDKTIYFKNGSSVTPVDGGDVARSKGSRLNIPQVEDTTLIKNLMKEVLMDEKFLKECFWLKLRWYQRFWLRLIRRFR